MDLVRAAHTAARDGAPTALAPKMMDVVMKGFESLTKISYRLKVSDQSVVQYLADEEILFTSQVNVSGHPVMASLRLLMRNKVENMTKMLTTCMRTLVVGASMADVRTYADNPHVHFYFHGSEAKDIDRIIVAAIRHMTTLQSKLAKSKQQSLNLPIVNTVQNMVQALSLIDTRLVGRLHLTTDCGGLAYHQLYIPDAGYNFDEESWARLFLSTGAMIAYVVQAMPYDLLPDLRDSIVSMPNVYNLRHYVICSICKGRGLTKCVSCCPFPGKTMVDLEFSGSPSYTHELSSASTALRKVAWTSLDVNLYCEIHHYYHPMTMYTVARTAGSSVMNRTLTVPEHLRAVNVLNMLARGSTHGNDKVVTEFTYLKVPRDLWYDLLLYIMSISDKALDVNKIMGILRKQQSMPDLNMTSTRKAMILRYEDIQPLAVAASLYAQLSRAHMLNAIVGNASRKSWQAKFRSWLNECIPFYASVIESFCGLFSGSRDFLDCIVKDTCYTAWQTSRAGKGLDRTVLPVSMDVSQVLVCSEEAPKPQSLLTTKATIIEDMYCPDALAEDSWCLRCREMQPVLGNQALGCKRGVDGYRPKFLFSRDCWKDQGLTLKSAIYSIEAKKNALTKLLGSVADKLMTMLPFSINQPAEPGGLSLDVDIVILQGAPGVGKSRMIRSLIAKDRVNSCVAVPYFALLKDYESIDGHDFSSQVRTLDNAFIKFKQFRHLYVDEATSVSLESLARILYVVRPETLTLMMDVSQFKTQLSEGTRTFGLNDDYFLNLQKMPMHSLLINHRNSPYVVRLVNELPNDGVWPAYQMGSARLECATKEEHVCGGYGKCDSMKPVWEQGKVQYIEETNTPVEEWVGEHMVYLSHATGRTILEGISPEVAVNMGTIRSNQGKTFEKVTLAVKVDDIGLITREAVHPGARVGLTRSTCLTRIVSDGSRITRFFAYEYCRFDVVNSESPTKNLPVYTYGGVYPMDFSTPAAGTRGCARLHDQLPRFVGYVDTVHYGPSSVFVDRPLVKMNPFDSVDEEGIPDIIIKPKVVIPIGTVCEQHDQVTMDNDVDEEDASDVSVKSEVAISTRAVCDCEQHNYATTDKLSACDRDITSSICTSDGAFDLLVSIMDYVSEASIGTEILLIHSAPACYLDIIARHRLDVVFHVVDARVTCPTIMASNIKLYPNNACEELINHIRKAKVLWGFSNFECTIQEEVDYQMSLLRCCDRKSIMIVPHEDLVIPISQYWLSCYRVSDDVGVRMVYNEITMHAYSMLDHVAKMRAHNHQRCLPRSYFVDGLIGECDCWDCFRAYGAITDYTTKSSELIKDLRAKIAEPVLAHKHGETHDRLAGDWNAGSGYCVYLSVASAVGVEAAKLLKGLGPNPTRSMFLPIMDDIFKSTTYSVFDEITGVLIGVDNAVHKFLIRVGDDIDHMEHVSRVVGGFSEMLDEVKHVRRTPIVICAADYVRSSDWSVNDVVKFVSNPILNGNLSWVEVPSEVIVEEVVVDNVKPHPQLDAYLDLQGLLGLPDYVDSCRNYRFGHKLKYDECYYDHITLNNSSWIARVGPRGNLRSDDSKFAAFGVGPGNYFTDKEPSKQVCALAERYAGPQAKVAVQRGSQESRLIRTQLLDRAWRFKSDDKLQLATARVLSEIHQEEVLRSVFKSAAEKSYFSRLASSALDEIDEKTLNLQRFSIKASYKPPNTTKDGDSPVDPNKVAQGIAAQNVHRLALMMFMSRILMQLDVDSMRNDSECVVITDHGKSNAAFMLEVRQSADRLFEGTPMKNAVGDAVQCDANVDDSAKDLFIARYSSEDCHLKRLLKYFDADLATQILDFMIHGMNNLREFMLQGSDAKLRVTHRNGSGNYFTLWLNNVVNFTKSASSIDTIGRVLFLYKGDDTNITANGIKLNEHMDALWNKYTCFRATVKIGDHLEFIGMVNVDGTLYPCIPRIAHKIYAMRAKGYKHFAQYQISIRDTVDAINAMDTDDVVRMNALHYGWDIKRMEGLMHAIMSIGHISLQQWRSATMIWTEGVAWESESGLFITGLNDLSHNRLSKEAVLDRPVGLSTDSVYDLENAYRIQRDYDVRVAMRALPASCFDDWDDVGSNEYSCGSDYEFRYDCGRYYEFIESDLFTGPVGFGTRAYHFRAMEPDMLDGVLMVDTVAARSTPREWRWYPGIDMRMAFAIFIINEFENGNRATHASVIEA